MSIIDFNIDSVQDLVTLPDGEHELRIIAAEIYKKEGTNRQSIKVSFKAQGEPNAATIYQYIGIPGGDDDEEKRENKKRQLKSFCEAFNVDLSSGGIDTDTLPGLTGWAVLATEADPQYGDRNVVKRFVVPN